MQGSPVSSTSSSKALRLELRPSRQLLFLIAISHGGACVLPFLLSVPVWASLCAALLAAAGAWHGLRLHVLRRHPQALTGLHWRDDGEWEATVVTGAVQEGLRLDASYAHAWLVILYLAPVEGRRRQPVLLLRDSLDPSAFRRLRVRLRLQK